MEEGVIMNKRFTRRNSDGEARKNPLILEDSIIRKLCEYEELEEQGLLLKLPCKVGQTVYAFDYPRTDIVVVVEEKVEEIKTCRSGVIIESTGDYYHSDEIGRRVFLTKEEAEQALAKMEKEK